MEAVQTAIFLSMVVMAVTEYLKQPLINTRFIVKWMVRHHIAYIRDNEGVTRGLTAAETQSDRVVIWCVPYITFVFGLALSLAFRVNLVAHYISAAGMVGQILSAIIIGCGSNVIHDITSKFRPK